MSCYAGPDVSFGPHGQCRLWVDCWGKEGGMPAAVAAEALSQGKIDQAGPAVLQPFRKYFAQPDVQLVWHNYSFDAHILRNYGVEPNGLVGDTMHMARLWDSSLGHDFEAGSIIHSGGNGTGAEETEQDEQEQAKAIRGYGLAALSKRLLGRDSWKTDMKSLFGRPKLRQDGTPGKAIFLPPLEEVQTSSDQHTVAKWVHYSTLDAQSTWELFQNLGDRLRAMPLYRSLSLSLSLSLFLSLSLSLSLSLPPPPPPSPPPFQLSQSVTGAVSGHLLKQSGSRSQAHRSSGLLGHRR